MKSNGENTDGENGVTHTRVTVVTLTFDHSTNLVSVEAHGAIIALVQMIVDEAGRSLDIQRRQAAAIEFQKQMAEARRTADLLGGLNLKR